MRHFSWNWIPERKDRNRFRSQFLITSIFWYRWIQNDNNQIMSCEKILKKKFLYIILTALYIISYSIWHGTDRISMEILGRFIINNNFPLKNIMKNIFYKRRHFYRFFHKDLISDNYSNKKFYIHILNS